MRAECWMALVMLLWSAWEIQAQSPLPEALASSPIVAQQSPDLSAFPPSPNKGSGTLLPKNNPLSISLAPSVVTPYTTTVESNNSGTASPPANPGPDGTRTTAPGAFLPKANPAANDLPYYTLPNGKPIVGELDHLYTPPPPGAGQYPPLLEDPESSNVLMPDNMWIKAEYLVWFASRAGSPPLIQVAPDGYDRTAGLPVNNNSVFPFDGSHIMYNAFSGLGTNVGLWLTPEHVIGLDTSFFLLEQNSTGAAYSSLGSPILARYYMNANNSETNAVPFSNMVPFPGYSGSLSSVSTINSVWSGDASLRWNGFTYLAQSSDWLFGFRYFGFRERLDIIGTSNYADGSKLTVADHFATSNNFYGGQVGISSHFGRWYGVSIDSTFKFAMGDVDQRVVIQGYNTMTSAAGGSNTQATGLFAQSSNSGVYERGRFAVIPQVNVNINYHITQRCALTLGYNFMYISSVVRPASQLPTTISDANLRYVSNPTAGPSMAPSFHFQGESFWLQGVNLGMKFDF